MVKLDLSDEYGMMMLGGVKECQCTTHHKRWECIQIENSHQQGSKNEMTPMDAVVAFLCVCVLTNYCAVLFKIAELGIWLVCMETGKEPDQL